MPVPVVVLSHAHIAQAMLNSADEGRTLEVVRKGITVIDDEATRELVEIEKHDESKLQRLSLAYNAITTLPASFANINRVNYLSLRGNGLAVIPEVLTIMPSLAILDISRNKLTAFPPIPGTFLKLRVLHIGRNRITRLPAYFPKMTNLNLFRIDRNPLDWPPRSLMDRESENDTSEAMSRWIKSVRKYMTDNAQLQDTLPLKVPRKSEELKQPAEDEDSAPFHEYDHSRNLSIESIVSTSSSRPSSPTERRGATLGPSLSGASSPLVSPSISPDPSVDDHSNNVNHHEDETIVLHSRNASFSVPSQMHSTGPGLHTKKSLPDLHTLKSRGTAAPVNFSGAKEQPGAPSIEVERNSYFKRSSKLLPSTVAKIVPPPLLKVIDSVRGILFALSQIYSSLRHYTVFAIDERLSGVLSRVLDPASTYMSHLITGLDRFDTQSKAGIPPPTTCRAVLESCKDNVAVFRKVVGMLQIQLKVLAGSEDIRYTRTLLLMLYGSTAEISNAWRNMLPHLDTIQPFLKESRSAVGNTRSGTISSIEEEEPSSRVSPPISRSIPSASQGRRPMTRRHAGSFSTKDVQLGRAMPNILTNVPTVPSASSPVGTTPLRSALRNPFPAGSLAMPPPNTALQPHPNSMASPSSHFAHSRESSLNSFYPSPNPNGSARNTPHPELPSDSSKLVDHDLLTTMQKAIDIAQSVWTMMAEVLNDIPEAQQQLQEKLISAQSLTSRLRESIKGMLQGNGSGDRKQLWEQANMFAHNVVKLSTALKPFLEGHAISSSLRPAVIKLTQATHDATLLLGVSSFTPVPASSAPSIYSPYSPAIGNGSTLTPFANGHGHSHSHSHQHYFSQHPNGSTPHSPIHAHSNSFARSINGGNSGTGTPSSLGEDLVPTARSPPHLSARSRSANGVTPSPTDASASSRPVQFPTKDNNTLSNSNAGFKAPSPPRSRSRGGGSEFHGFGDVMDGKGS